MNRNYSLQTFLLHAVVCILFTSNAYSQIEKPLDSLYYADQYLQAGEYDHAFDIYKKNKKQLNSKQQFHYAELLLTTSTYNGDNTREAFKWYKKSAEGGYEDGIFGLMMCYMAGQGVTKDSKKALILNKELVTKGNVDGIYMLAERYEFGFDVEKDMDKAILLMKTAAAKNFMKAVNWLERKNIK